MTSPGSRSPCALIWFREDLRLADNPALTAAVASGVPVTALFVLDETTDGFRPLGGASRWWLAQSLKAHGRECAKTGLPFAVRKGPERAVIERAVRECGATRVLWSRRYGEPEATIDADLQRALEESGVAVETLGGRLLHEPDAVRSGSGAPFKVYTAFWRAARAGGPPRAPLPAPSRADVVAGPQLAGDELGDLGLEPRGGPDWARGLRASWTPGEAGARAALDAFLDGGLRGYAAARDRPDLSGTSRLSPHLRFGEISPVQLWHASEAAMAEGSAQARDVEKFRGELGWREFAYHLLAAFPDMARRNAAARFDDFPWRQPEAAELKAWRRGLTGYPIVDAGMRQLWRTGWMHNRVRMITASFLIKDLLVDWRIGEAWFWDTLVDADPANNAVSWQWVAGSGADAAPYFRVFNPVLQGRKFDPSGDYVRTFLPELGEIPTKWIHAPWEAPAEALSAAGVELGRHYPRPIVDHAAARKRALAALAQVSGRVSAPDD
ncbi:deoxyribodipyrimidine photo-lyase [Hansschlegelia sp.]|uniref:cryptochrome/photolyase family protein n=1 Tax=Hansschlegelia sp. TaxID=2041892 RepID=UPI002BACAA3D|nr:deoxyribodipyrimidine photo-lyase [Hansschlegelia sp.]HVI29141.1 deoxyribodipyrimidine photo-lyase [Hansschlegelia sp.]